MIATSLGRISTVFSFLVLQLALSRAALSSAERAGLEASDPISLHIACAESQLAVSLAEKRLAEWRHRGHARLYHEGHGSWINQAQADSAFQIAASRTIHAQRYCDWLKAFAAGNAREGDHEASNSLAQGTDRIDVMIPGSRAVIGWVRPMALPPEFRSAILDLMRLRADVCQIDPHALDHSIQAVDEGKAAVQSLKSAAGSISEVQHTELKRDLAVAELQRIRAEQDLREFEFQQLSQFAEVSILNDTDVAHDATPTSERCQIALFRQAREILDREIGQQGMEQAMRVNTEWTQHRRQAALRFRESRHSMADASVPALSPNTEPGANQADARRAWLSQWLIRLDAAAKFADLPDTVVQAGHQTESIGQTVSSHADVVDILPVKSVPHELRRDLRSCKRLLELVREWYGAEANVAAARIDCDLRSRVLTRVTTSARSNQQESAQLRYSTELKQAELKIAEDDRDLIAMLIRHALESPPHSPLPASNLRLIDAELSHILLQTARHRVLAAAHPANEDVTRAKSRRDSLVELQKEGQASHAEVQAAEVHVRQAVLRWRASDQQQRLAEIDARLMAQILALRTTHATTETNGK
ncbi:MAG: hypothetical protein JWN70_930 [Planctomycetaceae bacterium]|nr:hypothetical protein [Planctomycetaceae bacterium]